MTKISIAGRTICALMLLFTGSGVLYAVDLNMSGVIAYPVPFNPKKEPLSIRDNNAPGNVTYELTIDIYDINSDSVFKRSKTVTDPAPATILYTWSGYNNRGKMVKPGMYIIRVRIEDAAGKHGEKIIRILVNY